LGKRAGRSSRCRPASHFKPGKSNASSIYDFVERAKRYRDGSPLERLTMDIEDAERHCSGAP
jgi:hypothetical protein